MPTSANRSRSAPTAVDKQQLGLWNANDCLPGDTVNLFAGPGGMDEAARMLGVSDRFHGIELNRDACATAITAGYRRERADVTKLDPTTYEGVTGLVVTPPCPTFSDAGKRQGLDDDYQKALDAITCLGEGCGCDIVDLGLRVKDPRTALVVQTAKWALTMPDVEWLVAEQVEAIEYLWEDLAAELSANDWEYFDVVRLDAKDFGAAARRDRVFLLGRKTSPSSLGVYPREPFPTTTMAQALGWGPGDEIRTRGERTTSGGNLFPADQVSLCLTGSSRSWKRESNHQEMTAAEAGTLQGFPKDFPWKGSRTAQFQQLADVVNPLVGAAVLGTAMNIPWEAAVRQRVEELYAENRLLAAEAPPVVLGEHSRAGRRLMHEANTPGLFEMDSPGL